MSTYKEKSREACVSLQPSLHNLIEYCETVMSERDSLVGVNETQAAEWGALSEEEKEELCGEFTDDALDEIRDSGEFSVEEDEDSLLIFALEEGFDHDAPHDENGNHPTLHGLVYFEVEEHHSSLLLTTPAAEGDALISFEDWYLMIGTSEGFGKADSSVWNYGYASDEYLTLFDSEA